MPLRPSTGIPLEEAANATVGVQDKQGMGYGPEVYKTLTAIYPGVWSLVNGDEIRPVDGKDWQWWEARNASAFTTLASTIEDSTFWTIQNMDDVTEAWKKLKVIYKPPGSQAFYRLMKEAMTLKMESKTVELLAQRIENL
ncbi:MAG: hypothetical protein M1826_002524 [Phylliscum demangeonii]|nr:MAG: hypothetical protein M1826_002524 [Phylliscum demangeonii]